MRIILTGKSGVGKSTLQQYIHQKMNVSKLILTTTRPPRPSEENMLDYVFVSKHDFDTCLKQGVFSVHTDFKNNSYGFKAQDFLANCVAVLDAKMVEQARHLFPDALVFKLDLPEVHRIGRLLKRGTEITSQDEEKYDSVSSDIILSTMGTRDEVYNRFSEAMTVHLNLVKNII